ncbi:MAG TPA: FAD-dependent oxidoreductase [Acetobacteraceae bacterium]
MPNDTYDVAVIGGGLVGAAIAWGLCRIGARVVVLDEGDVAHRASRGNFALVWLQSKGFGMAAYANWTKRSTETWPDFAAALADETGVDVCYQRPGGFNLCLSEQELETRKSFMARLHNQPELTPYPYEFLDRAEIVKLLPGVGPDVVGGSYCPLDGHVNSLRLLRALHRGFEARGGMYLGSAGVASIDALPGGGFRLATAKGTIEAAKIVLTAGLGNARLAPMVGLSAPVRPLRGQIIVTERCAPFLHYPISTVRQTNEGSVMVGDSQEESGDDTTMRLPINATMASRAVRMFPMLASLNVVRTWSALRVMTPDGFPIYEHSEAAPGAFLATCHSGVTLAANHALTLAPAIMASRLPDECAAFTPRRFDVRQAS